jgi:hypothetical protein
MESTMKYVRGLAANLVAAGYILLCGLLLSFGLPLRAQQSEQSQSDIGLQDQISERAANRVEADSSQTGDPDKTSAANRPVKVQSTLEPLTFAVRWHTYEHSFLSPEADIGPILGAAFNQAIDYPRGWGHTSGAFGRRVGSLYGQDIISRTIRFGVATVDREDPRFYPSNETGLWKRTKHAILETIMSKTPGGGEMPAFSRFAGLYGSAAIANTWEPKGNTGVGHIVENGSIALAGSVGWHIFAEFWPDIRNRLHRQH